MSFLRQIMCSSRFIKKCCRRYNALQVNQAFYSSTWTSTDTRNTFYQYFRNKDHQYVHSSSVIPAKDAGTYFVNAGMNQFKPIFLGTIDADSEMAKLHRVFNSQKCIRVGGKHNDLDDVGRDTFHHTFFEMLGSWSFGDYFKYEACSMAWQLLTEVYQLPKNRLYVTYFGGNQQLGLGPDHECREIWLSLGISAENILPFSSKDNFWDMGDTGPCGPCTEIHYDRTSSGNNTGLINTDSAEVVELWNLVFMQYDRQPDGRLLALPSHHVDTGMGLERLTAVLQGKQSNYDTDLFKPLFDTIHKSCNKAQYGGYLGCDDVDGIDRAYRVVADHARMFTVAIADGVRPGTHNQDSKLRHVLDQCLYETTQILETTPGTLSHLVPVVVELLGAAFPELNTKVNIIQDIVSGAEDRYRHLLRKGEEIITKVCPSGSHLKGSTLVDLQDGVWQKTCVPLEISQAIAAKLLIPVDIQGFNDIMMRRKAKQVESMTAIVETTKKLHQQDVIYLKCENIPLTESHYKYHQKWHDSGLISLDNISPGKVVAIKTDSNFVCDVQEHENCSVIFDKTPFYAEAGGQVSDIGTWQNEHCRIIIRDVQEMSGYVLHTGTVQSGTLHVQDSLHPSVDLVHREQCARNHSATHLLNFALRQLADGVTQQGSKVSSYKLVFDFNCSTALPSNCLQSLTDIVSRMICDELAVCCEEMSLDVARNIPPVVMMQDEVYPANVRVVSVGKSTMNEAGTYSYSSELCAGCHVANTRNIQQFVITHCHGMNQPGTKRIIAVTGPQALQIQENAEKLKQTLDELERDTKSKDEQNTWQARMGEIERLLFNEEGHTLPKIDRDNFILRINIMRAVSVNYVKNKTKQDSLEQEIQRMVNAHNGDYFVGKMKNPKQMKKLTSALCICTPEKPVLLFTGIVKDKKRKMIKPTQVSTLYVAVAFIPESFKMQLDVKENENLTAESWIGHMASKYPDNLIQVKNSINRLRPTNEDICVLQFLTDNETSLDNLMDCAKNYMENIVHRKTESHVIDKQS